MREGWTYKKLVEVCDFQGGSQPPKNEWSKEPQIGYVRMLQIRDFTQNATDYIEYVKISKSLKYCAEDDILIGRYGASVGKILTGLSGAYNVAIIKTIPKEIVNKNYVKYYFLSSYFQHNLLVVSQHRAAQAGFSKEDIKDFQISCPSLAEQERIVAELDLLSGIIEKKKEQLKAYDQLAQSIFYTMFGDPITNEKGWEVKNLGEISAIGTGATPSREKEELYYGGDIHWVKTTEVHNCEITDTEETITQLAIEQTNCKIYPPNTLLMAMYGQGKTRGQIAKLKISAATNQACAAIMLNNSICNLDFVYELLHIKYDNIRAMAQGGNQANLNMKLVGSIPIILPSLTLQQSFASKIEAIEKQKSLIQQSIAETQTLFDSRMDHWFS